MDCDGKRNELKVKREIELILGQWLVDKSEGPAYGAQEERERDGLLCARHGGQGWTGPAIRIDWRFRDFKMVKNRRKAGLCSCVSLTSKGMMSWMRWDATRRRDTFQIHELELAAPISQRVRERSAQSGGLCAIDKG